MSWWHPAVPDADGDGLDVDVEVSAEGRQVLPGNLGELAGWCGGEPSLDPRGVVMGEAFAAVGDHIMRASDTFMVSPADGHHQRWQPA